MTKAIVIGASSGIGRALALRLAKEGMEVGVTARRVSLLEELKREIPDVCIRQMDVRNAEETASGLAELISEMNGADLIIYNSGVDRPNPAFDWKTDYDAAQTNAMGFVVVANVALEYFMARKRGHLVGISSFVAIRGNGKSPLYSATKAFMAAFMRGLRQKLLGTKIGITDIRPGYVQTDMIKGRKQAFWLVSPEQAADDILRVIQKKSAMAYVPARWWFPAIALQMTPDFIYDQVYLKKFAEPAHAE